MREQGRLTEWNDERGFGFIEPLGGGPRVFAHINEFPKLLRRPIATDLVTYTVGRDERKRPQAQAVAFMAPAHARHQESAPLGSLELAVPAAFGALLLLLAAAQFVPIFVLWFYLAASLVAFAMYWWDKAAALRGGRRTSEATLLGIAVFGGWPGAYVARHLFRHKTRKQPFRTYFWMAVGANCVLLAMVLVGISQTPR
jgi:uncharacterized membrane protein YsdA (DUF1294 family)/cold shock CspA family protein